MKNTFRLMIAVVMIVAMFAGVSGASAALVSYNSGIQVQNLEATQASITLIFYNRDGSEAARATDTVAANGSNTYFPLDTTGGLPSNVPSGFEGSVVIESNTAVAAIANIVGSNGTDPMAYGASYSGFKSGSVKASVPLLMKGNFGFNTFFSVQNVGGANADVSVTYSDGVTASATGVKPGAAAKFDQATENHAAGWVGSATVTSGQPIVSTALEVGPSTLFAYDGFGAGSTFPVMPLVQENNFDYVTGVQIQNRGTTDTDVTVTYTPGPPPTGAGTGCTETRTVKAGKDTSFALYVFTTFADPNAASLKSTTCTKGTKFVGAAKVTGNTASVELVAIVNQLNNPANKGAAYNAFDPASGTERVVFPLIMDRNYGYFTGFNVVNVGTATIAKANLTCTVTGKDISGAKSVTFNPPGDLAVGAGWNQVTLNNIGDRFVGSASCVGPAGSKLVGSVNEVSSGGTTDTFLVYEGTNP